MSEARERVARGAALLDRERPGWYREIDLERLNIASCFDCVCGQLYGGYVEGLERLGIFYAYSNYGMEGTYGSDSQILTELWREAIRLRLDMDSVPGEREKETA